MRRVLVIGCGGSGKTHLARRLAWILDVPVVHLDGLYYDSDWNPADPDVFAVRQQQFVAEPAWVIEGNYASTLALRLRAADTVILLDLPARTCLWGVLQRRLRHGRGQRPDEGIYNRLTWDFLRYICRYRTTMLPRVHALIAEHAREADLRVIHSRRQAGALLRDVESGSPS